MLAFLALIIAIVLFGVAGCGRNVELDPRDAEALAAYEEESGCDRNTPTVTLKILNRGSAAVEVYLQGRSGATRRIGLFHGFERRLKSVGRYELDLGGSFLLRQASGLSIGTGIHTVPLNLLQCDVGILEIGASVSSSFYMGMDFYPNEDFRK